MCHGFDWTSIPSGAQGPPHQGPDEPKTFGSYKKSSSRWAEAVDVGPSIRMDRYSMAARHWINEQTYAKMGPLTVSFTKLLVGDGWSKYGS